MSDKKKSKLSELLDKIPFLKKLKNIKHIEIIICIIFISLILLIYFGNWTKVFKKEESTNASAGTSSELSFNSSISFISETEEKLERVLSNLEGVGKANVMITLESGPEIVIANNLEEKTTYLENGTEKNVSIIKTPIIVTEDGVNKPIILMEILPKIQGVIVIAEGADDVRVKLNIYQALQAIVSISSDNIQVFAGDF